MADLTVLLRRISDLQNRVDGLPVLRWAVVTSITPLLIQMDGDTSPLLGSPSTIASGLAVGDRVQVSLQNNRVTVQGRGGGRDVPVGVSFAWTGADDKVPHGYLIENGQAVSRTTYAALFALYGTFYGAGDGSTTFNIRDRRGRVGVGVSSDTEFNELGKKYGTKTHTLTIAQIPSHSHSYGSNTSIAANGVNHGTAFNHGSYATGMTGGGGAHNNIQPSIAEYSIVRAL